jgi:hypothetical protein
MRLVVDRGVSWGIVACVFVVCAVSLPVGVARAGCVNEQLRAEQPYGLELPDCRAYEMVSPLSKDDNNIAGAEARASVSGDAITYASKGAFAGAAAGMFVNRYLARRGGGGWSTKDISPPYKAYTGNLTSPFEELLFTPDLSKGLLRSENTALTGESPEGYVNLYVASTSGRSYQAVTGPPPGLAPYIQAESSCGVPTPGGVSADLSRVVFTECGDPLTADASPGHNHVYEWAHAHLSLVDVPPAGVTFEAEDGVGAGPASLGSADRWHAVSADGSLVFFTGAEPSPKGNPSESVLGQVYVREVDRERTVEVSASQKTNGAGPGGTDADGPQPARYWGASVDGSRVFFTSRAELTDDANTGAADNAANLYEYDLGTGVLSDLTVDTNAGDLDGASVLGLATASDDGTYVYFVAEGKLAEGALSGHPNLYLRHAGETTFIATLAPASRVETDEFGHTVEEDGSETEDWRGNIQRGEGGPGEHTVRVSPDGARLAFVSELSLTGFDNEPVEPGACQAEAEGTFGPRPCSEVYMYDAATKHLACVSCDPNGARPIGPASLGGNENELGTDANKGVHPFYSPRNFSEGGRLFFQSMDPLVPHDSNGSLDVYEYEEGQVRPISDVAGNAASFFLDASPSGDDAFIATADQLLPSDTDFRIDAYDVKLGGGFPVLVAPSACENGDSCKAPVSTQPGVFGAPATATFSGAGNPAPAVKQRSVAKAKAKPRRCRKGYLRKHGRCVKRRQTTSNAHSKSGRK